MQLSYKLDNQRKDEEFEILGKFEFTSKRSRMSVILKDSNGTIIMYTKGSDQALEQKLKYSLKNKATYQCLNKYANDGLRTLVVTSREIPRQSFYAWKYKHDQAKHIQNNYHRERQMILLENELENELQVLGATAIEDKLQDEAFQTICRLKQAGIKIWILTGDKFETSKSIGYSCNLLDKHEIILSLHSKDNKEIENDLQQNLEILSLNNKHNQKYFLFLNGATLKRLQENISMKNLLNTITNICNVVVVYRMSAIQKAQIVKMVRNYKPDIQTLSIGDGANDVPMLRNAHVGVGIEGNEGCYASKMSDYSIQQFKYLSQLLFQYGSQFLRVKSNTIKYLICILTIVLFTSYYLILVWYRFCLIYIQIYMQLILIGAYIKMDIKYSKEYLLKNTQIYKNQRDSHRNQKTNLVQKFCSIGLFQAVMILIISYVIYTNSDDPGLDQSRVLAFFLLPIYLQSKFLVMSNITWKKKWQYLCFILAMHIIVISDWNNTINNWQKYLNQYSTSLIATSIFIFMSDLILKIYTCNYYFQKSNIFRVLKKNQY